MARLRACDFMVNPVNFVNPVYLSEMLIGWRIKRESDEYAPADELIAIAIGLDVAVLLSPPQPQPAGIAFANHLLRLCLDTVETLRDKTNPKRLQTTLYYKATRQKILLLLTCRFNQCFHVS